jgi:uncharacterized protein involved in exopolysaccharide biosynthesis
MEQHKQISYASDKNEVSLKDLILRLRELNRYVLSKWYIVIIIGIIGGVLGITYSFFKKTRYIGALTFVLEENSKSGGLGSYAGLANQFGIDLGGMSGNNGLFTEDNILEFLRSRLMVERALLTPVIVDKKEITLANYYIDFNNLREKWVENTALSRIDFPVNADRSQFTLLQDSLLNEIYKSIIKTNLVVAKPDKKVSFISVKCTSLNERFSKEFTTHLVFEATSFYVATKTKRSKSTIDRLQARADSIEKLLNQKTYSAAVAQDLNLNPARSVASVNSEMVTRDKVVLQTTYGEVIKNLEISKITMAQETPLIQIVDTPLYPLEKDRLGKVKGLIIGGFLASFLTILFLILKKIFKSIMED